MHSMIDLMMAPGTATAVMTIGPAFVGVVAALVAGVAWIVSQTGEELRRVAARDWEARSVGTGCETPERLAA